jgi:hypothetical protein
VCTSKRTARCAGGISCRSEGAQRLARLAHLPIEVEKEEENGENDGEDASEVGHTIAQCLERPFERPGGRGREFARRRR